MKQRKYLDAPLAHRLCASAVRFTGLAVATGALGLGPPFGAPAEKEAEPKPPTAGGRRGAAAGRCEAAPRRDACFCPGAFWCEAAVGPCDDRSRATFLKLQTNSSGGR